MPPQKRGRFSLATNLYCAMISRIKVSGVSSIGFDVRLTRPLAKRVISMEHPLLFRINSGFLAKKEKRATFSSPSTDSSRKEYLALLAIFKYAETGVSRSPEISR